MLAITAPDKVMADAAASLHLALFVVLSLLLVHVVASLRHHYWYRSAVLTRTLPGRGGAA